MSNSPLVCYVKRSPMNSGARNHGIDTITIHHMAGNLSVETCGQVFQTRQASSNYGVDSRGRVGLYVDEANRSWASSSPSNDHRAVTIEVANCGGASDWPVSDKAYAALIALVADICRRNGIRRLVWGENKADRTGHKNGCNMTVHRDFAATSCPGPYLLARMPQIAREVNKLLEDTAPGGAGQEAPKRTPYTVRVERKDVPIRTGPGTDRAARGLIPRGVYTIVEEADGPGAKKWGRLKSGAGWIALDSVRRL